MLQGSPNVRRDREHEPTLCDPGHAAISRSGCVVRDAAGRGPAELRKKCGRVGVGRADITSGAWVVRTRTVDGVKVDVRHSPSFAVARVGLDPGEQFRGESGTMMATSAGVEVKASTQGGVMKGLKRSFLGGESLFITTYTAPVAGGWVDVAHHLAGDIITAGVSAEEPMSITKGCWLASSVGVDLDTKWGGFKNLFGGEGGFLVHATGVGTVLLACYGALDTVTLGDGEALTIDSGHVVAFGPTVRSELRKVTGGVVQMLKSGEGLVFDFTGPGWVMMQSRNPSALEAWIRQLAPGQTGGASGGMLGNLFGD